MVAGPGGARALRGSAISAVVESLTGRGFRPGKSGNPACRAHGARSKPTLAVEALLDGELETLTRKVIELAKAGDRTADDTRN
jgi:hypothetical protein